MRLKEMVLIPRDTQKKNTLNRGQEATEDMKELELGQRADQWWGAEAKEAKLRRRLESLLDPAELVERPQ